MKYRRKYTLYSILNRKGKKVWYFRIYLPDGTRRAKSTGCTSKEKAMMYVEQLLDDEIMIRKVFQSNLIIAVDSTSSLIQSSIPVASSSNITFEEFASPWWHWDTCPYVLARRSAGTELHPGIKQSYVKSSEMWTRRYLIPYFGKCKLSDISVDMINTFWQVLKDKQGLAPKTINNIRSVFIIMMKEAVSRGLIERNPVEMTISKTVDKKKQELLTDEECARLFDPENMPKIWGGNLLYYAYSFVAGLTGLRAGELLALTIRDVTPEMICVNKSYDSKHRIITTTKTSEERNIPITHEIYRMLYVSYHSHPKRKADYIFSSDGVMPINEAHARKAFYRALEKIGISEEERARRGITFHSWRHKVATDCVKANMHPLKIMALTGHKNAEMLFRYTDLNTASDLETEIKLIQREKMKNIRI